MMLRNFDSLKLIRGIFYRSFTIQENLINQLVPPRQIIQSALIGLHNNMGHPRQNYWTIERQIFLDRNEF